MNVHHTNVHVVQQVRKEFDAVAGRKKYHYLFLFVLLKKSEEKLKLFVSLD